jgi:peptidoglycan/LPS O-acetylase OafA/YrhL
MSSRTLTHENNSPLIRLDFVDALRLFAILYVIASHLVLIPEPDLAIPDCMALLIINGGNAGVSLFFVLSAFSLSYSMDARKSKQTVVRHFYIRRVFRIVPLFYVMILIYWIRDALVFGILHPASEVFLNASLLFNLVPACITSFVWGGWTIGVIAFLYLLFPLIHKYIRNLYSALALFSATVLIAYGWSYLIIHYGEVIGYLTPGDINVVLGFGFLQHLPVFACGIVVYRLLFDYFTQLSQKKKNIYGMIFITVFIVFYAVLLTEYFQNTVRGMNILHGICFSCLVLGLGLKPFHFLVNSKTTSLGKISYSMYLFHPIIIFTIIPVYRELYHFLPVSIFGYLVSLMVTLVLLTVISWISYKYLERPGIAFGEKFIRKRSAG